MKDIEKKIISTVLDSEKCFSGDVSRLLRAVRFKVSKRFKFSEELEDYMNYYAKSLFQSISGRGSYKNEFKKMFEDEGNYGHYLKNLLNYGLIPKQNDWGYMSEDEKARSKKS